MTQRDTHKLLEEIAERVKHDEGFNTRLVSYRAATIIGLCKGPAILELGCGDGLITCELARYFQRVVAVDGSNIRVERARERLKAIKKKGRVIFCITLFENLELEERFDTVITAGILEHIDDPIEVLRKAGRWLKPTGVITIVVPNAMSLHRRAGRILGLISDEHELTQMDFSVGHKRYYDLDMLKQHIREADLEIDCCGGLVFKPLSNAQMEQLSVEITDAFYELGKELPPEYCAEIWARCTLPKEKGLC